MIFLIWFLPDGSPIFMQILEKISKRHIVKAFLQSNFDKAARHLKRVEKIFVFLDLRLWSQT